MSQGQRSSGNSLSPRGRATRAMAVHKTNNSTTIAATVNQTEVAKLLTAEEKAATNKEVTAWLTAHPKKK